MRVSEIGVNTEHPYVSLERSALRVADARLRISSGINIIVPPFLSPDEVGVTSVHKTRQNKNTSSSGEKGPWSLDNRDQPL